jgi:hypothetical protein
VRFLDGRQLDAGADGLVERSHSRRKDRNGIEGAQESLAADARQTAYDDEARFRLASMPVSS